MTRKRYVLLESDGEITPEEWRHFAALLEEKFGITKLIPIAGQERMMVARTEQAAAYRLRAQCADVTIGQRNLKTVLTSGSLGKLKSVAKETKPSRFGQVPQR